MFPHQNPEPSTLVQPGDQAPKPRGARSAGPVGESWRFPWLLGVDGTETLKLGLSWEFQDMRSWYPQNFLEPRWSPDYRGTPQL